MTAADRHFSPAEAAARLGVSAKALRLYEQRGLVAPTRTAAGYRAYGPAEMARAREIVQLRGLGLSLAQVASVIGGDPLALGPALAAHQAALEDRLRQTGASIEKVAALRAALTAGAAPSPEDLAGLMDCGPSVAFDLPWPWGGERFELDRIRPLTWIVGPLGSGKTRLAQALAAHLPGAAILSLDREPIGEADPVKIAEALAWLADEGATITDALKTLVAALEASGPAALVVDMVEQGLDHGSQEAVASHIRQRARPGRPLFLMTRSSAMLDLAAARPDEAILYCPPNHSPPLLVAPWPGSPGYEGVASCLAAPDVRARTEGMIAVRPAVA